MTPHPQAARPRRAAPRFHQRLSVRLGALGAGTSLIVAGFVGSGLQSSFARPGDAPAPVVVVSPSAAVVPNRAPEPTRGASSAPAASTPASRTPASRTPASRTPASKTSPTTPRASSRTSTAPTTRRASPWPSARSYDYAFGTCQEARAAGALPIRRGDPGFGPHLDRNNNGIGCEIE